MISLRKLKESAGEQINFFSTTQVLSSGELLKSISLGTLVVLFESLGFFFLYPVMGFIEAGMDVVAFVNGPKINSYIAEFYRIVGLSISLYSLMLTSFCMICCRQIINYFSTLNLEKLKWKVGQRLGGLAFKSILNSRASFIKGFKRGDFTVTVDYECQASATLPLCYIELWRNTVLLALYLAIILVAAMGPGALILSILFFVSLLFGGFIKKMSKEGERAVVVRAGFVSFLSERFGAWRVIKLNSTISQELDGYLRSSSDLVDTRLRLARIGANLSLVFIPTVMGILFLFVSIMLHVLKFDLASVVIFIGGLLRLVPVTQAYQRQLSRIAQFDPSRKKIEKVLKETNVHAEITGTGSKVCNLEESIELRNVKFKYSENDALILNNINLTIQTGTFTAIIGESGAGKTTLLDLLCLLNRPTDGELFFDGVPHSECDLVTLRSKISFVNQEPFIFNGTVRENVVYGVSGVTDEIVMNALRDVGLLDVIQSFELGLDTVLSEQGSRLSVGQRQRLSIARALASDRPVILMDEPTSALDNVSASGIKRLIETLVAVHNKTVVVITHRLDLAANADLVVCLKDGSIYSPLDNA